MEALKQSHEEEQRFHDEAVGRLEHQHKVLQTRLETMYEDRLDGRVSLDQYDAKAAEWRKSQDELNRSIAEHRQANRSYLDEGVVLLELAQHAVDMYVTHSMDEKRKLVGFVCWNSMIYSGVILPNYRQPFDILADTNRKQQRTQTTSGEKSGLRPIKLRRQDLNL